MALAFLEKTPALYASMRPQWLRNLEIDMGLKKEIESYVAVRGGEYRKHKEGHGWTPTKHGVAADSKLVKPLWNNPSVSPTKIDPRKRFVDLSKEDREAAFAEWEKKKLHERRERLAQRDGVQTNPSRRQKRGNSEAHQHFCQEKVEQAKLERIKMKQMEAAMEQEWNSRMAERAEKVRLMKLKNQKFRKVQKLRLKKGPPGSRKRPKAKRKPQYFAEKVKTRKRSQSILSEADTEKHADELAPLFDKEPTADFVLKPGEKLSMSTDDIAQLYRLSVSPLVKVPPRPTDWSAVRPSSAPKELLRFLQRLEATTDAPPDMRPAIRKSIRNAQNSMNIRVIPPFYETPDHLKSPEDKVKKHKKSTLPTRPYTSPTNSTADSGLPPMSPAHAIHKKSVDLLGDVIYSTGKKVANDREAAIAAELVLAEQTVAAQKLQNLARGRLAKKRVARVRQEQKEANAALKIQAVGRRQSARKRVAQIRQDKAELEASTKIQAVSRRRSARKRVAQIRQDKAELEASTKIQALSRRRSAQKRVAQIHQHNAELNASVKIQAVSRRRSAQKRVALMREDRETSPNFDDNQKLDI